MSSQFTIAWTSNRVIVKHPSAHFFMDVPESEAYKIYAAIPNSDIPIDDREDMLRQLGILEGAIYYHCRSKRARRIELVIFFLLAVVSVVLLSMIIWA